jgi:hypothetical protein
VTYLRRGLGVAGVVLALVAVSRDDPRLAWGAIAALLVSLILRLLHRSPSASPTADQDADK